MPQIEVSPGELVDRLAILTLKSERIEDPAKRKGINAQLSALLMRVAETFGAHHQSRVWPLYERLKAANMAIWDGQEEFRKLVEAAVGDRDHRIARRACQVHLQNDERFRLKREIDAMMEWATPEEKSYL